MQPSGVHTMRSLLEVILQHSGLNLEEVPGAVSAFQVLPSVVSFSACSGEIPHVQYAFLLSGAWIKAVESRGLGLLSMSSPDHL